MSTFRSIIRRCRLAASRLSGDRTGTAAVEFAFILPIMVVLYFGCVEISEAVSVNRKVTAVSSATGDLVAQSSDVDDSEIDDILDAAEAIIAPYPVGPLQIVVSGLQIDSDGNVTVIWSDARNTTARAVNSSVSVPAGLQIADTCLVMAEVDYQYSSALSDFFTGPIDLDQTFYLRPRKNDCVARI